MNLTKIEWVKNPDGTQGYTWNPITGCLNGCEYCYARKLANGRLRTRYLANWNFGRDWMDYKTIPTEELAKRQLDPFYPRFWEERLNDPINQKGQKGIFVCDMSDLFGIGVPEEWTRRVLNEIRYIERHYPKPHRFYLLTKQPQNLARFSPFPENCWVGVTATNQHQFDIALAWLPQIKASLTFLSIEPHLEHIRVKESDLRGLGFKLGWLIDGAQSNPYKPPKLAWVEEIIEACRKADIPYFLKDNLGDIIPGHMKGDKLRQEMPKNLNPAIDK